MKKVFGLAAVLAVAALVVGTSVQATSAVAAGQSSASASASSTGLVDLAGTGSKISDPFSLPGGIFRVCWDVRKRSPSPAQWRISIGPA